MSQPRLRGVSHIQTGWHAGKACVLTMSAGLWGGTVVTEGKEEGAAKERQYHCSVVKSQSYKFIYLLSADLSFRANVCGEWRLTHNASACHNIEKKKNKEEE